jgi:transcriptional regulator with PAS, ATPase and Fis domain
MVTNIMNNIKQRFRIVGDDKFLNRALEKAIKVSYTDISVLVRGESGVGKEFIPKIIHNLSPRKHYPYIAINCGAIPEGTIDSELFGISFYAFSSPEAQVENIFRSSCINVTNLLLMNLSIVNP